MRYRCAACAQCAASTRTHLCSCMCTCAVVQLCSRLFYVFSIHWILLCSTKPLLAYFQPTRRGNWKRTIKVNRESVFILFQSDWFLDKNDTQQRCGRTHRKNQAWLLATITFLFPRFNTKYTFLLLPFHLFLFYIWGIPRWTSKKTIYLKVFAFKFTPPGR